MSQNKVYTAIGLMSGTSLDGIDLALVKTDGMDMTELVASQLFEYDEEAQKAIRSAFGARHKSDITDKAEALLTHAHIKAVQEFMSRRDDRVDVIGFHGQTILHDPSQKFTWQIGDSAKLAEATAIDVIGDMRQADVKAGGQGAPLLPICHRAFATHIEKPIAILNLGGVGNITWLGSERTDILAFDTGPANALIDDLVKEKTGRRYDSDGCLAKAGKPRQEMIDDWLTHEYFKKPVPKSLDRDEWEVRRAYDLDLEDAVATLAEFTVQSILQSLTQLPDKPHGLYVAGGGRHNKYMMERLNAALDYAVEPVETLGWDGDMLEAQGFGYMAIRSLLGLSITLPSTTGISEPMTGGVLYKAPQNQAAVI